MKYRKEKIKGSKLNPKNWGVPDYSDKGSRNAAFAAARKAGEKEFMWNNARYHTNKDTDPIIKNPENEREVALNNHYKEYYPEFLKNYNSNRPNVNVDPEIDRASYSPRSKTLNIPSYGDVSGDFIAELAHHKQENGFKKDIKYNHEYFKYGDIGSYSTEGTIEYNTHRLTEPALYMQRDGNLSKEDILKLQKYLKVKEDGRLGQDTYRAVVDKYYNKDIIKEYLSTAYPYSTAEEFRDKRINQKYPDTYDNTMSGFYLYQIGEDPNINLKGLTHNKEYYYGQDDNWEGAYFDDNQLLKLNPNNKNFDTLALQRELSNRGYKLPKSTKEDGDFDGIWGDETKNALSDYQTNNYAEGGKLNNYTNINMKYNKDKQKNLKKFATGGKTPAQIMEEARRNQALWKQQQEEEISASIARDAANTAARDAVNNSGIPAYQSPPVSIQDPRSLVLDKINPDRRTYTMGNSNLSEVVITGKAPRPRQRPAPTAAVTPYTDEYGFPLTRPVTDRNGNIVQGPAGKSITNTHAVNNSTDNTLTEEQLRRNAIIREYGTEGLERMKNTPYNESGVPQSALQNTTIPSGSSNFMERGLFGWISDNLRRVSENSAVRREEARNRSSRGVPEVLQRAGTVANKLSMRYQQGGQLPLRNGLEKFFRIEPRYTSVDSTSLTPTESVTDYMDNTLRGPQRVSKIRKPVDYGSGYLTSTRVIRNPWTDKADTTYVAPSGDRFNQFEATRTPSLQSYPNKFGQYFKYQQGGKVESPSDEMYVDFAVRYLSALGVGETEMVDEEGGLREEYAEAVTVALQEIDSPEFWEHYHSNPDEAVGAYVESKQSPEQVEMAKKGAKLKMLKKAKGGKVKKCKCGCGMTMKKEKGGKLTEVCSCGCKN